MDWAAYRDEFPTLGRVTYYNTVSLGCIGDRSRARLASFVDAWEARGSRAWMDTWMAELDDLRASFARLVNARPDEVALGPSVSHNLAAVAAALDVGRGGGRVLSSSLDFPTLHYLFRHDPRARVELVKSPDGVTQPVEMWAAALDTPAAGVVTSHAFFATGYVQDMRRIAAAARRHGAFTVCDAYHTTGQLPVDVKELGVDVLVSGGLKWLVGGPGISFLYVRKDLADRLEPSFTGWFANEHQFDFDPTRFAFRAGARRFEPGTPALPSCAIAAGGLDIVNEIGPTRIRERAMALATDLAERLADGGARLRMPKDPAERVAILMVEHGDPRGAVERLFRVGIVADARPGAIRLSPYFYNTETENERVAEAVLGALQTTGPADNRSG